MKTFPRFFHGFLSRCATGLRAVTSLGAVTLALVACGESSGNPIEIGANLAVDATYTSWKLPRELREISGLAFDRDNGLPGSHPQRLYAVADERAVVVAIHASTGDIESVFSLGKPAERGDFEGIAVADGWLYLVTSDGQLLRTRGAADGAHASFQRFDLGTQDKCEIEGLAEEPGETSASQTLWVLCKELLGPSGAFENQRDVRLYAWSIEDQRLSASKTIILNKQALIERSGTKGFSPSGVVFVQGENGPYLFIIASAQRAFGVWRWQDTPELVHAGRLPTRHRQAEGLEIGPDRSVYIADEGGKKRARLRVYPAGSGSFLSLTQPITTAAEFSF